MDNSYGMTQQGSTLDEPHAQPKKSTMKYWIIGGCGCLSILCLVVVAGLLIYFWPSISLLFGGEPTAALVPSDSMAYVNIDLLESQSDDLTKIVNIVQEMSGTDQNNLVTSLDDSMSQELGMTVTDSILPWIGRYAALVVISGDLDSGNFEYMAIVQSRDNGKADQFIWDLVSALEDRQGLTFTQTETDGITLYTYSSGYSSEDVVIARAGKFVYFANSENPILDSVSLKKSDSLANVKLYKNAIAALPKKRLATVYINADANSSLLADSLGNSGLPGNYQDLIAFGGMAMSISVEDVGLRLDVATAYDENNLSDFQKETMQATFKAPMADNLVPGDTFFFFGVNSSQSPGRYFQDGSPVYTQDVKDALTLFDDQYGINIQDLMGYLGGETALAIGPSRNSVLSDQSSVNIGLMFITSTNDETGILNWFSNGIDALSTNSDTSFFTSGNPIGSYELQELSVDDYYSGTISIGSYGAGNGYFILGSGQDMLEKGLDSTDTLAKNTTYRDTWKAFPSGSVPYMYLDTAGLVDAIGDYAGISTMSDLERGIGKIPVVALSMNKPQGYTQSSTLIVFIDYK